MRMDFYKAKVNDSYFLNSNKDFTLYLYGVHANHLR